MRRRYAIVIERAETNYSAYAPDVPGCVATGDTVEEVTELMREALALHFEATADAGEPVPESTTRVAMVDVPDAAEVHRRYATPAASSPQ